MKRFLALLLLASCATPGGSAEPYTLDVCIVSDNKLGSMGDPVVRVYDGKEVKFCCAPCVKEFEAEQASFMAKLEKLAVKK